MRSISGSIAELLCLASVCTFGAPGPGQWIPARWEGGPLEAARRAKDHRFVEEPSMGKIISGWYDSATLDLLNGTPINCLLVSFSAGLEQDVEAKQHELVARYTAIAHQRGVSILGLIYPGRNPVELASAATHAGLDGLVLDGDFAAGFARQLEAALHARSSSALVIPITRDAASMRMAAAPVVAVKGVPPSVRNLADEGIRAGASAEPWIESNIWLVRSFRLGETWRPVWVDQQPARKRPEDYTRSVADAALAGGRWIISLDDELRKQLFHKEPVGLSTWKRLSEYLRFAEDHAGWRQFVPYGNVAIVVDMKSDNAEFRDEYLNLTTRRQVPYRIIDRALLSPAMLEGFQAVLAADVTAATDRERQILREFAERGGLVVAGSLWGDPPKGESYNEIALGRGRVVVYADDPPDPEAVAKDLKDLMEPEAIGFSAFNVPSAITYVSTNQSGKQVLIQFLNYSDQPYGRVTVRFNGSFKAARLYTPEGGALALETRPAAQGRTEVLIADPVRWGALVLE